MCVNGMFVAIELKKSEKEQADLLQDHHLEMINTHAKGIGLKVSPENWEKVYEALVTLSGGGHFDRSKIGAA